MKLNIDIQLLDISLEIYALEDHYALIEKQILHLNKIEKKALDEYRKKESLTPEDPEWNFARQEFEQKVEFLVPRFFWGSFIVSLYAVFETSVIEIAHLIQENIKQGIGINDLKGDFPKRAKKYYENALKFELCNNQKDWQHIIILTKVRHAIAHANGRLEMMNEKSKRTIKGLEKQNIGISFYCGYLMADSVFAKEKLSAVSSILKDLIERYKEWFIKQKSV